MKKIVTSFLLLLFLIPNIANAQKWVKNARKAQVKVIAYNSDGDMNECQGIIIGSDGMVITGYDALKGATKVIIIDASGKEYPARYVHGASSMYNTVKLQMELPEKAKINFCAPSQNKINQNDIIYILPNARAEKSVPCITDTITQIESFKDSLYQYYTLSNIQNERLDFSPVYNQEGQLFALIQPAANDKQKNSFAIDINYGSNMHIVAMDAGNADLKSINLPKPLPETAEEAATFIFLTGRRDSSLYMNLLQEYVQKFPQQTSGYTLKAEALVAYGKYQEAEQTYANALEIAEIKADEIHYSMAKTIYDLNTRTSYQTYNDWTLDKALSEANKAYEINPLPVYLTTQGACLYALKKYDEACNKYLELNKTNMRSPENFLYAAQCKQMAGAEIDQILALQDSAVACFTKPYPQEAASFLLMRGTTRAEAGKYRDAVLDYNEYEHLLPTQVTAKFYYEREQLEMKCRMFPAALNDIERAVRMDPREPVFRAEEASVKYRLNQIEEAIIACQEAIRIDSTFADAYRILGVCYSAQGEKEKARQQLKKAIELGDTISQGILDKLQ